METGKYMLIKCPKCNELTPASRFCKNCGALDERIYAELEAEHCPHCGALDERIYAELEAEHCPHCGKKVAKGNFCGTCGEPMNN
jgi:ribosomal protein L32